MLHIVVNRTTLVQSAKSFGLLERDVGFADLFNRVFHTFCEELFSVWQWIDLIGVDWIPPAAYRRSRALFFVPVF